MMITAAGCLLKRGGVTLRKALPIGIDDFEKIRRDNYYYVDKTLMIKDFLEIYIGMGGEKSVSYSDAKQSTQKFLHVALR